MVRLGEMAAFGTAICWTASALFFERSSKRVGTLAVNFFKVCAAFALLIPLGLLFRGMPLPLDAPPRTWFFLILSGLVGFVIADHFLFSAYVLVGSRLTVLFQPLTPLVAAFLAYIVLGERMRPAGLIGMSLVASGILTVVFSRNSDAVKGGGSGPRFAMPGGTVAKGLACALASALFQAVSLIFSKLGLDVYDAIGGTQIRVGTAVVGFALQALVFGRGREVFVDAPKDRRAMGITLAGAVFGPFAGVTLSLIALRATSTGAASTLMNLTPVLIIPPSILFLKQKIRPFEILGACVAVCGATLFFLL